MGHKERHSASLPPPLCFTRELTNWTPSSVRMYIATTMGDIAFHRQKPGLREETEPAPFGPR